MSKVKIDYYLENETEIIHKKLMGIINQNVLIFNMDSKYKLTIFPDKLILKKTNGESEINVSFILNMNTTLAYNMKEFNMCFNIDVFTNKLIIMDNVIDLVYTTDEKKVFFRIKYEVIK